MSHRVISLVLAALIGATPVAREICELSCAGHHDSSAASHHDDDQSMAGHHMSHHEMADATTSSFEVSVSSSGHGCTHDGESQPVAFTAKLEITPPALAPQLIDAAAAVLSTAARRAPTRTRASAPVSIALRTPLRV